MKKAEVKFENITKKFNETTAVDNVSCNFEAGTASWMVGNRLSNVLNAILASSRASGAPRQ